jgi:hypothetical protein
MQNHPFLTLETRIAPQDIPKPTINRNFVAQQKSDQGTRERQSSQRRKERVIATIAGRQGHDLYFSVWLGECASAPLAPGCATNAPVGKCTGAAKMRQHFPLGAIHWWRKTVCASSAPVNLITGAT